MVSTQVNYKVTFMPEPKSERLGKISQIESGMETKQYEKSPYELNPTSRLGQKLGKLLNYHNRNDSLYTSSSYGSVLKKLLIFSIIIPLSLCYPSTFNIEKHPQIYRQQYNAVLNFTTHNSGPKQIINFQASLDSRLKPLICISSMEYNFEEIENITWLSVGVDFEVGSPDAVKNKTYYNVWVRYAEVKMSELKVGIMFFSVQLQTMFEMAIPLFYSIRYRTSMTRFVEQSPSEFNLVIDLALATGIDDFQLPDSSTTKYEVVKYLNGFDMQGRSYCWRMGINPQFRSISQTKITFRIDLWQRNTNCPDYPAQLRSIEFSIFIFHKIQLQNSQHYIRTKIYSLPSNQVSSTPQYSSSPPLNLGSGQFLIGLDGVFTQDNNWRLTKFQLDAQMSSSPQVINITLSIDTVLKLTTLQSYFLFIGYVRCPGGTFYNSTSGKCQNSPCPINYYIAPNNIYSSTTCLPCNTGCIKQPNSSIYTCSNFLQQQHQCTPCTALQLPTLNLNNMDPTNQLCFSCQQYFGTQCQSCDEQQCFQCSTGMEFYINKCVPDRLRCNDKKWMTDRGEQCDSMLNGNYSGCDINCTIMDGFICPKSPYLYINQPSSCYYTKPANLSFIGLTKQQFSNTLALSFKLIAPLWDQQTDHIKAISVSSPGQLMDNLTILSLTYNPTAEIILLQLNYDLSWIQNQTLQLQVNPQVFNSTLLTQQGIKTQAIKVELNQIQDAYFMLNHNPQLYSMALSLVALYKMAAVCGMLFVVVGFVGGKYIVLQVMAILQVTFLGMLQLQKYTPLYLAVNRLSIISGGLFTTKSLSEKYQQLNTLGLEDNFLGNVNIQLLIFIVAIVCGVVLIVYSKLRPSQRSILWLIIGQNLVGQYSLYGLLIFSYLISASVGLQVSYQLLQGQGMHISGLVVGVVVVVVTAGYLVVYFRKAKKFGQFFREMEKFSVNERFLCLLILEKLVVGFMLGIYAQYRYTGCILATIQMLIVIYAYIKQPFYYPVNNQRFIANYSYLVVVLVVYNMQKLFFSNTQQVDSTPWLYAWPIVFIFFIFFFIAKNTFFLIKQLKITLSRLKTIKNIYQDYIKFCQENKETSGENNEEIQKNYFALEVPQKVELTENQLNIWKNFTQITKPIQFDKKETNKNDQQKEDEELLTSDFRAKMAIKRLDKNINKKVQQKLKKSQKSQNNQNQNTNQTNNNLNSIEEEQDEHSSIEENEQNQAENRNGQRKEVQDDNLSEENDSDRSLFSKKKVDHVTTVIPKKSISKVPKNKKQKDHVDTRSQLEKIYFSKTKISIKQKDREPMTKQQYDEKIKEMSFAEHWKEIDQNADKFTQKEGENPIGIKNNSQYIKENQTEKNAQQKASNQINSKKEEENIKRLIQQIKKFENLQTKELKPTKKIFYRGGSKFNSLQKKINKYQSSENHEG